MKDPVDGLPPGEVAALVRSWWDRVRQTTHFRLEAAHALHVGFRPEADPPLGPCAPVPGCDCPGCHVLADGGSSEDAQLASEIVGRLARSTPDLRHRMAEAELAVWRAFGCALPSAAVLVALAERHPSARLVARTRRYAESCGPLPLQEARAAPILRVSEHLGLDLTRVGRSYRGRCPLHNGDGPNFSVLPEINRFRCFVCGESGDGIALTMEVLGVGFLDAVREVARVGP